MTEIRFSGFGGQGIIRLGLITGRASALFDNKHATLTQSFGPEARGGACSAQLIISDGEVPYPYITNPDILVAMSQEAYTKFAAELKPGGILIIDEDLVHPGTPRSDVRFYTIPATRFAEQLGNRIVANIVMLGFFTAVTKVVSREAMHQALPALVPARVLELNRRALDLGYEQGVARLAPH